MNARADHASLTTYPSVADAVRSIAQHRPHAPAIHFAGTTVSYGELHARSNAVAHALLRRFAPGSRIALLDGNAPSYFEIFLGATKARCTLVAINARLAAPEIAWILKDSQCEVLFVGREHQRLIEAIESELTGIEYVALDATHPRWSSYAAWRDANSVLDPPWHAEPDDDIIQLYTSGTTGHPKGVCHTNRTWAAVAEALRQTGWTVLDAGSVNLVCLPLFHVAGFNPACFTLLSGGRLVLMRRIDALEILQALEDHHVTDTLLVPTVIHAVVNAARERGIKPQYLRTLGYGAAPIPEDLLREARQLFGCSFLHLYGMTENLGASTYLTLQPHDCDLSRLNSCGCAFPGSCVKVVDAAGDELPRGQIGEVIMRAPWIMREYWRNAAATHETIRDGWLWSGDAAYMDDDGYLFIQDRIKDMIKTGGENVYPAEVESALFSHPCVAEVAVVGVRDDYWGEVVKAFVVLQPGATLDVNSLSEHARQRIGHFKVPKQFQAIAALPRNASGKILRRALRDQH